MKVALVYWSEFDKSKYGKAFLAKGSDQQECYLPLSSELQLPIGAEITDVDDYTNEGIGFKVVKWRYLLENNLLCIHVVADYALMEISPEDFIEYVHNRWLCWSKIEKWAKMP